MRKILVIISLCILSVAIFTGCGKNSALKEQKKSSSNTAIQNNENATTQKQDQIKQIGDPSKMDDSEFMSVPGSGEPKLNIDDVDVTVTDLGDIDSLVNNVDPLAGIPSK
jgi:hypothetical protein